MSHTITGENKRSLTTAHRDGYVTVAAREVATGEAIEVWLDPDDALRVADDLRRTARAAGYDRRR